MAKKNLSGGGNVKNMSFPKSNQSQKDNKPKYKGPIGKARRLVNIQIKDATNDIRSERRQMRRISRRERNKTNSLYRRSKGDINHIFDETGDYIGEQNRIMQERHDANEAQTLAAQAALQQQLGATSQQNASGANAELERLGINAPNTLGQFAADAANNQGLALIQGSNQMANLNAMEQGDASIGNLLASMNEGSRISQMGIARNNRDAALADTRQARQDAERELLEALRETKGQRKDMVLAMLEQLRASGWSPHLKNALSKGTRKSTYVPYGNKGGTASSGSEYPDWGVLGNTRLDGLNNLYGKRRM